MTFHVPGPIKTVMITHRLQGSGTIGNPLGSANLFLVRNISNGDNLVPWPPTRRAANRAEGSEEWVRLPQETSPALKLSKGCVFRPE